MYILDAAILGKVRVCSAMVLTNNMMVKLDRSSTPPTLYMGEEIVLSDSLLLLPNLCTALTQLSPEWGRVGGS